MSQITHDKGSACHIQQKEEDTMDPAFILSLVYGHLFSKGVDSAMAESERHISEKEFSEILDDFDQKFKNNYDAEITSCGCDMQSVIEKRTLLIPLAEKYINQDNSDISRNLKKDFVKTACREVFGHEYWKKEKSSEVVEKYMGFFYDLVFMKEISGIPAGYRALLNAYIDNQHDINQDLYQRILALEKTIKELLNSDPEPVDFGSYYQEVERRFTSKKRGEYKNLVGEEPDESSYIDAYIIEGREQVSVMSFLDNWFGNTKPGVILIHGEPGHGKTTLCYKASFEFHKKRLLKDKAKNVVAISLNTGKNPEIVKEGKVRLSNALVWGPDSEYTFSFEDCRGALLFLDGFDEFIDKAKEADINNIFSFMEKVDDIADNYGIHIVVLSRTIAVTRDLKNLEGSYKYYKLLPVSDKQQDRWLDRHKEYDDYREAFIKLRNNKDMKKLLEVPFLFRLIVNSRFETVSSNIVELYDNLFIHLMHKRNIYNETLELVNTGLMNLAFEVYCTDTNMAKMEWDPQWLFAFYVESDGGDRIGFFHRSFYQYFLAKYIYSGITNITDENVEDFIGSFAERELDETVRQYLELMYKKEDESKVHPNIGKMIDTLVRTEAYLNFTPRVESGDAERSKTLRSTNIYRNTLQIAAAVSFVLQIPFEGSMEILIRTFNSQGVILHSEKNKVANLSGANLSGAKLSGASLYAADLSGAYLDMANLDNAYLNGAEMNGVSLWRADLRDTKLHYANLKRAFLVEANLNRAELYGTDLHGAKLYGANLSGAKLYGVNLVEANLVGANLSGVNLNLANLSGASIDIKYKNKIHPSTKGYSSIRWIPGKNS